MPGRYGHDHRLDRARWQTVIDHHADLGTPITCWRCSRPIPPRTPTAWQLGHRTDLAIGGRPTDRAPECQPCNSTAGGRLRHQLTDPEPSRNW